MFVAIYRFFFRVRARLFTSFLRSSFYSVGSNTVIAFPIRLLGEKSIEIGSGVFIGANSWLQVMPTDNVPVSPVITIGDETSIVGACTITAIKGVVIEPRVLMAANVYISDHTHAHASRQCAVKDQGITNISRVRICEGAWLGQNVVVCPGVTIGRNAVIGANSVVRQDIADFCVAAGAPARVIRSVDGQRTS
jgi:acetyltransferase-like isoleucine patch superfamily enzyme